MACLAFFSSTYEIHRSGKKTQKKRAGELEEDYINLAIFDTVASENWRAEVSCSYKFTINLHCSKKNQKKKLHIQSINFTSSYSLVSSIMDSLIRIGLYTILHSCSMSTH